MIDDLLFKDPFSWKLSKRRNRDSHLLTPFDTSLKGFYNLRARVSDNKEEILKKGHVPLVSIEIC
jgi:hypothetical protein